MNAALRVALKWSWGGIVEELSGNQTIWSNGMPSWNIWSEQDLSWHLAQRLVERRPMLPSGRRLRSECVHFEASMGGRDDGSSFNGQRVDLAVLDCGAHSSDNYEHWRGLLFIEVKIVHRPPHFERVEADATKLRRYLAKPRIAAAGALLVVDQRDLSVSEFRAQYRGLVRKPGKPRLAALVYLQKEKRSLEIF